MAGAVFLADDQLEKEMSTVKRTEENEAEHKAKFKAALLGLGNRPQFWVYVTGGILKDDKQAKEFYKSQQAHYDDALTGVVKKGRNCAQEGGEHCGDPNNYVQASPWTPHPGNWIMSV